MAVGACSAFAKRGRRGEASYDMASYDMASYDMASSVLDWSGGQRPPLAWQARTGTKARGRERQGEARFRRARQERRVLARRRMAWRDRVGRDWRGGASLDKARNGSSWMGRQGKEGTGMNRIVVEGIGGKRTRMDGMGEPGKEWQDKVRTVIA
jgi:hypothetical protein